MSVLIWDKFLESRCVFCIFLSMQLTIHMTLNLWLLLVIKFKNVLYLKFMITIHNELTLSINFQAILVKGVVTNDIVGRPTEIRFFYKQAENENYVVYFPNFNLTMRDPGNYGELAMITLPKYVQARFVILGKFSKKIIIIFHNLKLNILVKLNLLTFYKWA